MNAFMIFYISTNYFWNYSRSNSKFSIKKDKGDDKLSQNDSINFPVIKEKVKLKLKSIQNKTSNYSV